MDMLRGFSSLARSLGVSGSALALACCASVLWIIANLRCSRSTCGDAWRARRAGRGRARQAQEENERCRAGQQATPLCHQRSNQRGPAPASHIGPAAQAPPLPYLVQLQFEALQPLLKRCTHRCHVKHLSGGRAGACGVMITAADCCKPGRQAGTADLGYVEPADSARRHSNPAVAPASPAPAAAGAPAAAPDTANITIHITPTPTPTPTHPPPPPPLHPPTSSRSSSYALSSSSRRRVGKVSMMGMRKKQLNLSSTLCTKWSRMPAGAAGRGGGAQTVRQRCCGVSKRARRWQGGLRCDERRASHGTPPDGLHPTHTLTLEDLAHQSSHNLLAHRAQRAVPQRVLKEICRATGAARTLSEAAVACRRPPTIPEP